MDFALGSAAGTENVLDGANGVANQGTQWWQNGAYLLMVLHYLLLMDLANNTAVAAEKSNLYFGTGLYYLTTTKLSY